MSASPFACSHHSCSKLCHLPSRTPPPCPFDPEHVVSCACGRCRIARSSEELEASSKRSASTPLPPRTSCTSPLPTCTFPCSKPLPCDHLCQATCHWDPCPPCTERVERTCRCGATKHKTPCGDAILAHPPSDGSTPASEAILCDKPCQALRSCGRHQCGRICCPLASLASLQRAAAAKSSKRREAIHTDLDAHLQNDHQRDLHECDLPCGRVLQCGNHRCERRDHKGPCGVCPRGVFEELVCLCGRTVLDPPIACGTRLRCVYPCARPAPACGHPHVPHACHEGVVVAGADTADEGLGMVEEREREGGGACPPCPFLTEKVCACGKKRVPNVRCAQEKVSCGSMCRKCVALAVVGLVLTFFFFFVTLGSWDAGFIIANDSATLTRVGRVLPSVVNPVNHGASHVLAPRSAFTLTSPCVVCSLSASPHSTPAHKRAMPQPPAPKTSPVWLLSR